MPTTKQIGGGIAQRKYKGATPISVGRKLDSAAFQAGSSIINTGRKLVELVGGPPAPTRPALKAGKPRTPPKKQRVEDPTVVRFKAPDPPPYRPPARSTRPEITSAPRHAVTGKPLSAFEQAFAKARQAGVKTFEFGGKSYTTKLKKK